MGACCLCACVFRIVLGLLNTVILLVGLVIAAFGAVLLALAKNMVVTNLLQGIMNTFLSTLNVVDKKTLDAIPVDNMKDLLQPAGTALLIIGCIIAAVGALGYFGLSFDICLKIYSIIVVVVIFAEIIIISLYFSHTLEDLTKEKINETLVNNYVSLFGGGVYSMLWNVIMIEFKCCGVNSYEDFYHLTNTSHRYPKNTTIQVDGKAVNVTLKTPLACCQTTGDYPVFKFVDDLCAVNPAANNSNWNTGCWGEVYRVLDTSQVKVVVSFIILAEFAVEVMAFFIIRENGGSVKGS